MASGDLVPIRTTPEARQVYGPHDHIIIALELIWAGRLVLLQRTCYVKSQWFDKLTTSGFIPLALSLSKGGPSAHGRSGPLIMH